MPNLLPNNKLKRIGFLKVPEDENVCVNAPPLKRAVIYLAQGKSTVKVDAETFKTQCPKCTKVKGTICCYSRYLKDSPKQAQ